MMDLDALQKEFTEAVQAFLRDGQIEFRTLGTNNEWVVTREPCWNLAYWEFRPCQPKPVVPKRIWINEYEGIGAEWVVHHSQKDAENGAEHHCKRIAVEYVEVVKSEPGKAQPAVCYRNHYSHGWSSTVYDTREQATSWRFDSADRVAVRFVEQEETR